MKIFIQILLLPLPWPLRRFLLNRLPGFRISSRARIGLAVVAARTLVMEEGAVIRHFTLCTGIDRLQLGQSARIGTFNHISGFPTGRTDFFAHNEGRRCELVIGRHSAVTTRHNLDCTGGIYIGDFTTFAGLRSQVLTHSIDLRACRQDAVPVQIGDYCFVGTGCIVLKGAVLPSYSVLGAGSLLAKAHTEERCLYGGVPAVKLSDIDTGQYQYFTRETGYVH